MANARKSRPFLFGSRVRYRAEFCRSIGVYTGSLPFARGTVRGLTNIGDTTLAIIEWEGAPPDVPNRVNVANLEVYA